jgi:hypothetical protein
MMNEPEIFGLTVRLQEVYNHVASSAVDISLARDLNIEILRYILRAQMSDIRLYHHQTNTFELDESAISARQNFGRLFRQCDVTKTLPLPELGIVRTSLPLNPMPLPRSVSDATRFLSLHQRDIILDLVQRLSADFCIYISSYGVNQAVTLPTITIVLPSLTTTTAISIIKQLQQMYNPYDFDFYTVRFASGIVQTAAQAWFYPQVPPGASISAHEDYIPEPGVGTLGCYCSVTGQDEMYGLTAGHVVRPIAGHNTIDVYAPASKPFAEAVKTTQVEYERVRKAGSDATEKKQLVDEIVALERHFAKTIYSSTETEREPPHQKIDFALIQIDQHRVADNHVDRLPVFAEEFDFPGKGCSLTEVTEPIKLGEEVAKIGVRTGYSTGHIIEDAKTRWNLESTGSIEMENANPSTIPYSNGHVILGEVGMDGDFIPFARRGDSGSAVLRVVRDVEGRVARVEVVGIIYGVCWEEAHRCLIAFYLPLDDIKATLKQKLGMDISLAVPDHVSQGMWPYKVYGRGRSIGDLK